MHIQHCYGRIPEKLQLPLTCKGFIETCFSFSDDENEVAANATGKGAPYENPPTSSCFEERREAG